jgi:hypothetical protein
MGAAAGQDEDAEQHEHPAEFEIRPAAGEVDEAEGNGVVGDAGEHVRSHEQREQARLPQDTGAMRKIGVAVEKLAQECHDEHSSKWTMDAWKGYQTFAPSKPCTN